MGRPRTGSVSRHGDHYDIRITFPDGSRSNPMCQKPHVSEARAREKAAFLTAEAVAGRLKPLAGDDDAPGDGETLADWCERWKVARAARGLENADNDGKSLRKWVIDGAGLGARPVAAITRAEIEHVVSHLDTQVRDGALAWKTATNVWGLVTKAFADAQNAKDRALRVREDNPAAGVAGPDRGAKKAKTWLHPADVLAILANEDEPLALRRVLALQVYLYLRPGELRALRWGAVDLEAGRVRVHQAERRDGTTKSTKTKTPRSVPIEPALRPLLEAMHEESGGTGAVAVGMPKDTALADVLHAMLARANVSRPELFACDDTTKRITWYDLRATGITWRAIRGDDPLKIMYQAGHRGFATTQGYIREADTIGPEFGDVFPRLPAALLAARAGDIVGDIVGNRPKNAKPWWVDRDSNRGPNVETPTEQGDSRSVRSDDSTSADDPSTRTVVRADAIPTIPTDPIEAALADALTRASGAGEWSTVAALARELEARRLARTATNVVDLEAARRRNGGAS